MCVLLQRGYRFQLFASEGAKCIGTNGRNVLFDTVAGAIHDGVTSSPNRTAVKPETAQGGRHICAFPSALEAAPARMAEN